MESISFEAIALVLIWISQHQVSVRADICARCVCSDGLVEASVSINCTALNRTELPLDNIPWLASNHSIRLQMQDMGYTYLPKLLCSQRLIGINLDHNDIDSSAGDPFQKCLNLISVSLVNNSIEALPADFLKSNAQLQHLNLSTNHLSRIVDETFLAVPNLKTLDLSYNAFTDLTVEFLGVIPAVEHLNLEGNDIFFVQSGPSERTVTQSAIRSLNLSRNKFTLIASRMFENFVDHLQSLILSHNQLTNIEHTAFTQLTRLTMLDLSNNKLVEISLTLPDSLQHLILSANQLRTWPMHNLPPHLIRLQLQHNQLFKVFENNHHWLPNRLVALNLSHNQIERFAYGGLFGKLAELDLGHNLLSAVPGMLSEQAPALRTLVLDGNPIAEIRFNGSLSLEHLSMSEMPILQRMDEGSFANLGAKHDECLNIQIARCPNLETIGPSTFKNLSLCMLDLSYNRLQIIPQNATDWSKIPKGINLQGNPLVCNCSSQWLLDEVLTTLYAVPEHQHFLLDFRCHAPALFRGHRLVKYLKHPGAFCNPTGSYRMAVYPINSAGFALSSENGGTVQLQLTQGPGFFIAISVCALTLILLVLVGIYLTRRQRRKMARMNRRYVY